MSREGTMTDRILLVAPHADDELFGAGGYLLRRKEEGAIIQCVLVACSDIHMHHLNRVVTMEERKEEFEACCKVISTASPKVLCMKDSHLDQSPLSELVSQLDTLFDRFNPTEVLLPEPSYHQDHQYVHDACVASLRPTGRCAPRRVMCYEVPTSTWNGIAEPFRPNLYVDISGQLDTKASLLQDVYVSQYTRNGRGNLAEDGMIKHAQYRGIEAGVDAAEAFQVLKEIC
jgi:LmbE family N-acetylglucosaminyl deacetylase